MTPQQALAITLQQQIDDQAEQITDLQDRWVQSVLDPTNAATVDEMIQKIEGGEFAVDNKEEVLLQLHTIADSFTEGDKAVRFVAYTVKDGDCLTAICKEHNLDYEANKSILLAVNGLTNADLIRTGQTLLLPIQ